MSGTRAVRVVVLLICMATPGRALAWGETGHDVVTRVAAHLLAEPALAKPFVDRQHMLAHLANVPDIVWRNAAPYVTQANGPTHYIGLDRLVDRVTLRALPTELGQAEAVARQRGHRLVPDVGTAPWRVAQLWHLLRERLASLPPARDEKAFAAAVDEALGYAGILSHFVGDLAVPFHAVSDYDGWGTRQGGVHEYFESRVVDALGLALPEQVRRQAEMHPRLPSVLGPQEPPRAAHEVALALAVDSYSRVPEVLQLDQRHALLEPSASKKGGKKARRKAPAEVASAFEPLLLERLALGAEALAQLWRDAWVAAGSPNLSSYQSYAYNVRPDFIPPP